MNKRRICIISSTRADYGILSNLIMQLKKRKNFSTKLVVTGAHLSKKFGKTLKEIKKDRITIDEKAQIKFDIGSQLMGNKQFKNSIKMYSKAIDLQPDFAEAWNKRATLHYIIGDYEKSISDIFRTLELEPRHFGALDGLAEIYFLQNKFSKAAQTYNKILEILPYSKKAKMRLEYIQQSFI